LSEYLAKLGHAEQNIIVVYLLNIFTYFWQYWFFGFFLVLGLELRAYTLSHSTSPIFMKGFFEIGSLKLLARLAFNGNPLISAS
jgi:hypothetical protein